MRGKGVATLCILAVIQAALLGYKLLPDEEPSAPVSRMLLVGSELGPLQTLDPSGQIRSQLPATGRLTVLLAFDTACYWCGVNGPVWREWTQRRTDLRFVGVTKNELSVARRYAEAHEWRIDEILRLDRADSSGTTRALLGKTPWYFVVDERGTLVASGHGAEVAAADSAVATATDRHP